MKLNKYQKKALPGIEWLFFGKTGTGKTRFIEYFLNKNKKYISEIVERVYEMTLIKDEILKKTGNFVLLLAILFIASSIGFCMEVKSSSQVVVVVQTISLTCELCGGTTTFEQISINQTPVWVNEQWFYPFPFMQNEWHKECWIKYYKALIKVARREAGIKVKK